MLVFQPSRYTQRVVERLSFLPSGGEHWERNVQIRIPTISGASAATPPGGQCIVSLGMFRRSRFPDFTVIDASGKRMTLPTRRQHQHAIAMATISQYFSGTEWRLAETNGAAELGDLYRRMATLITDIGRTDAPTPEDVAASARPLLEKVGKSDDETERISNLIKASSELLSLYTHYLCWVPANWGETVSLTASYTMSDSVRLAGEPRKALEAIEDDEDDELSWWARTRMRFYTRLNLVPVRYQLRAPAHDHAGSYYLTIEPPDDAHVALLDWGQGRAFGGETEEIDCAFSTCHIHNGERLVADSPTPQESVGEAKISAFLKADPLDHAALLAVAVLNIGLAYLAQRGAFLPEGHDSQYQWLVLAPTVVVALIAQHHRRYYSAVTAPVRVVLWGYLAISVLFGASVGFDVLGDNELDDIASGGMACVSLALAGLLIASGGLFERVTQKKIGQEVKGGTSYGRRFLDLARHYADTWVAMIAIACLTTAALMIYSDWGEGRRSRAAQGQALGKPQPRLARQRIQAVPQAPPQPR